MMPLRHRPPVPGASSGQAGAQAQGRAAHRAASDAVHVPKLHGLRDQTVHLQSRSQLLAAHDGLSMEGTDRHAQIRAVARIAYGTAGSRSRMDADQSRTAPTISPAACGKGPGASMRVAKTVKTRKNARTASIRMPLPRPIPVASTGVPRFAAFHTARGTTNRSRRLAKIPPPNWAAT